MANIVSGFLAGDNYNVPAGYSLLIVQVMTWDRQNLSGATVTITGGSETYTGTTEADGRTTIQVPAGVTYTATLTHSGDYINDNPQTVIAVNGGIEWVTFNLNEPAIEVHENVSASVWVTDSTYTDFPYKCSIAISGVTSDDVPEVVFGVDAATSGDYAPIVQAYNGGIYIWSAVNTAVTIPTVLIKHQA